MNDKVGKRPSIRPDCIAIVKWVETDGIAKPIGDELLALGYQINYFKYDAAIPNDADLVFSFAPYGRFLQIPRQISQMPNEKRPIFLHWSMESLPNHNIPWTVMSMIGALRSWIDRLNDHNTQIVRILVNKPPLVWVNERMHKFRYIGDYLYAYRRAWLDILVETSEIHSKLYTKHGVPAVYVPWGTSPSWYSNLKLERDIDVLWMGKRRTRRRSLLIDQIREQLSSCGYSMYIADNVENPFIFGEERIRFLNRAKITLGLSPTWYDTAYTFRINLAAANRSLFVSEPVLPHSPAYQAGIHYISTSIDTLVEQILYYLDHENDRQYIVENAYRLVTSELTMHNSIKSIMDMVH